MRRRARFAAILAIFAVAGTTAALVTTRTASAFPPGTCNGSSCTGSTTDSFDGVNVCVAGTTVYWEDSYIPADVTNPRLAKFTVTPNPPCTGATVGAPTSDPWPASPTDPDGQPPPKNEPGKKIFRFRWTVTVPAGSKSNGTMSVAWTLDWTKGSGAGTTTTSGTPCPTSGALPAHCRYDLEVSISAPDTFSGNRVHLVKLTVTVVNNGPAASAPITHEVGYLQFQAYFATDQGSHHAVTPVGAAQCRVNDITVICPVRGLHPRGHESFAVAVRWMAEDTRLFNTLSKQGKVFINLTAILFNRNCKHEESSCINNHTAEALTVAR